MKTKVLVSLSVLLALVVIYCFCNPNGSFDDVIFKGVNKEYITQIRIDGYNLEEDNKIEDKEIIQEILYKLSKLNIRECSEYIPKGDKESYDIRFSNGNQYISYEGANKISDVQITFYNAGYIVVYGEGALKSKYYKISNSSEINNINEFLRKK